MKSLRSIGRSTAALTAMKSEILPLNLRASVNTDIKSAPPFSYALANKAGSLICDKLPLLGEDLLISAINLVPDLLNAALAPRNSGAVERRALISLIGTWRSCTSAKTPSMI